jgi:hypothetical protein
MIAALVRVKPARSKTECGDCLTPTDMPFGLDLVLIICPQRKVRRHRRCPCNKCPERATTICHHRGHRRGISERHAMERAKARLDIAAKNAPKTVTSENRFN